MSGTLYCGAARVDITPDEREVSGLFGLMGISYAGILDRISARVIALDNGEARAMIVAFDLDKAPEPAAWLPELAEKTGLPVERILYFATHTHSAPLTTVRPREKNRATPLQRENMNRYEAALKEKLFACAEEAWRKLKPARMGCAWGESHVNTNRNADFVYTDEEGNRYPFINEGMNWGAEVDRSLFTMRIEDLEGNPLAFLINYPMHCCLVFQNNYNGTGAMGISGDIAGNISRLMEEKFPGSVAVWSSGAAGDVDPMLFNTFMYPDPKDGHVVREPIQSLEVTLQQLRMIVGWHFKDICETLRNVKCDETGCVIASALEWSETETSDPEVPYRIRLQALRIGSAALIGIGGELYNSFGIRMRAASPLRNTVILNHTASLLDDAGYILDDDALTRAAQQAPGEHFIPGGRSGSLPGQVGPSLEHHTRSLINAVLNPQAAGADQTESR